MTGNNLVYVRPAVI